MKTLTLACIFGLVLLPVLGFACDSGTPLDSLEKIKSDRRIKVGYISYSDITSRDSQTGQVKGFLVDVLYEALADLNIPKENVEFVETDWQNFSLGLDTQKYNLSIAGTFNTPVRAQAVDFSRPIFYLGNGAVVKQDDNRFHSIEDFNKDDITIAVVQGEQGYEYAKKNLPKVKLISLSGSDLSIAPLQVKLGKADAALSDQYILRKYVNSNPQVKDALANNPYDVLPICWAVRKNNSQDASLLDYINAQLDRLESSGRLSEIMAKYSSKIPFAKKPAK
jgi:polar amino acid transport system substrate-binding protein